MARWRLRLEDFGRRQEGPSQTSEAWHQPRWAARKGDEDRPCSRTSRPSSARTPSPVLSSPAPPSVRAGGHVETWATRVERRDRGELPVTYGLKADSGKGSLLPNYDLWVTLHGGNGRWQQARAQNQWTHMLVEHEATLGARKQESERQRLRRAEAARQRRAEEEELSRRVEEAEADKRRRRDEELRQQQRLEEEARKARLEEERLLELMQPRKCAKCNGTGRCSNCQGEGSVDVLFLSPRVGHRHMPIQQGRRPRGCRQCGGSGDGSLLRDFVAGTGRCDVCKGERFIQPGGFKGEVAPQKGRDREREAFASVADM
ncbi:unnamed protein product [Effrenium voratum]|uniref:Uncharacterized protein n=1 Tax=Effrenium voratum TaxID=2562239 RepID=A0AA36N711_9DINO|nr:unnamed protein product [Effrenium voratum]CAJ1422997.1 unnamed protein product [Effrenium voratum]